MAEKNAQEKKPAKAKSSAGSSAASPSSAQKRNQVTKTQRKAVRKLSDTAEMKRLAAKRRRFHAVVPWILAIAAVYLLVCYIVLFAVEEQGGLVGFIGVTVVPVSFGLFGIGALLIPAYLLNIAVFYKRSLENGSLRSKCVSSLLNLIFISMLLHVFVTPLPNTTFAMLYSRESFLNIYRLGTDLRSGGIIGGYLCEMLMMGMGYVGAMIVNCALGFLSLVFVIGLTPGDIIDKLVDLGKASKERREENRQVAEYERSEREKAEKEDKKKREELEKRLRQEEKSKKDEAFQLPSVPDIAVSKPDEPSPAPETVKTENGPIKTIPELADSGVPIPPDDQAPPAAGTEPAEPAKPAEEVKDAEVPTAESFAEDIEESDSVESPYIYPPLSLLVQGEPTVSGTSRAQINATSEKLVRVLESFKVRTSVVDVSIGPAVTRYELQPAEGVKTKAIANLADDIALHLAARSVRIESPIPGKSAVGVELPNETVSIVRLRDLIDSKTFRDARSCLFTCLGMDVTGKSVYLDIAKMPHLLIAGATGMGKSVCINSILVSLLYKSSPNDVNLILIDPKKVEMSIYNGIPHLLVPVVTDPKKAAGALNWAVTEMERRFSVIESVGAHDIFEYNDLTRNDPEKDHMVSIVIFIDELADLMMSAPDDVETSICRLLQKARASGIHLVIGTQRPSVDVITGLIKSNMPSRIAFTVASQVDSRTILDIGDAAKLMGRGDMLFSPVGMLKPQRVQGAFVTTKEVMSVCEYIKRSAEAGYDSEIMESIERQARLCGEKPSKRAQIEAEEGEGGNELLSDEMVFPAIEVAIDEQTVSTSLLQRKLKLGYSRAAKIIDILESNGFVGKFDPAIKGRKIIITANELMELKAKMLDNKE